MVARSLPRAGRDARGFLLRLEQHQRRPQHPAAIHRVRRQQIENEQQEIARRDALHQVGVGGVAQQLKGYELVLGGQPGEQASGNQPVHQRSADGDPEFFPPFRYALRTRHAADRVHDDLRGPDPISARHQRMSQLVQQDRGEQRQHVKRGHGPRLPLADADEQQKDQQQDEREVEPHRHAKDAQDAQRAGTGRRLRLFIG
jgi:hypothetical protein